MTHPDILRTEATGYPQHQQQVPHLIEAQIRLAVSVDGKPEDVRAWLREQFDSTLWPCETPDIDIMDVEIEEDR